ncbi:hypothetical protein VTI74DRAFT_6627 [Chaetomium olivicolor]
MFALRTWRTSTDRPVTLNPTTFSSNIVLPVLCTNSAIWVTVFPPNEPSNDGGNLIGAELFCAPKHLTS